jgi:hypothetical protein
MSVLEGLVEGSPITVRVRKHHSNNPAVIWWNTYEFRLLDVGNHSDYVLLANRLATFEQLVHNNNATVDQVTIGTWVEDSHPYNPLSFLTIPYNLVGARALSGEAVDLRVALHVQRTVEYGRPGKLFFRGALSEGEITSTAGVYRLNNVATMQADIDDAVSTSLLDTFMGLTAEKFAMYMIGEVGASRLVGVFEARGVAVIKLNHKYFDRP